MPAFSLWLSLALASLTGKESDPIPEGVPLALLQHLAIHLELMDPTERGHLFASEESRGTDCRTIRNHWMDLRDAPPLVDACRWPTIKVAVEMMEHNRAYRDHLTNSRLLYPNADWLNDAIFETDELHQIWACVLEARCESLCVTRRRWAMKQLRDRIGPRDYYEGRLPPHVPLWSFRKY